MLIFAAILIIVGFVFAGNSKYESRKAAAGREAAPEELGTLDDEEAMRMADEQQMTIESGLCWEKTMEASDRPLIPKDLMEDPGSAEAEEWRFFDNGDEDLLSKPGFYQVKLTTVEKTRISWLRVQDTTPPQGEGCSLDLAWGEETDIDSLVANVDDVQEVSLSYVKAPDFSLIGTEMVIIRLQDESGNYRDVTAWVKIKDTRDYDLPVISGMEDRTIEIGQEFSFDEGVTAEDPRDGKVEVIVDSSEVNAEVPGVYPVTFSASDAAGHTVTETVQFTFTAPPPEPEDRIGEVNTRYDVSQFSQVIEEAYGWITTDGASPHEKADAIYTWVRNNMWYTGSGYCGDYQVEAMYGLDNRGGDCFTFFSVTKALLDRAGIENMCVTKILIPGRSDHYWLMVKMDGEWYHLDPTPRAAGGWFFLWTDEEMLEYSEQHDDCFDFDLTLYPRTPGTIEDRFLEKFYPAE